MSVSIFSNMLSQRTLGASLTVKVKVPSDEISQWIQENDGVKLIE